MVWVRALHVQLRAVHGVSEVMVGCVTPVVVKEVPIVDVVPRLLRRPAGQHELVWPGPVMPDDDAQAETRRVGEMIRLSVRSTMTPRMSAGEVWHGRRTLTCAPVTRIAGTGSLTS